MNNLTMFKNAEFKKKRLNRVSTKLLKARVTATITKGHVQTSRWYAKPLS